MRSNERLVTSLRIVHNYKTSQLYRSNAENPLETARWAPRYPQLREDEVVRQALRALAENEAWLAGQSYPAERPLSHVGQPGAIVT